MTYVGHPVPRVEDARLLRGRGRFMADLTPVGNIHQVAFVRSPHAHARIRGVDASAARRAEGVLAVITPEGAAQLLKPFSVGVSSAPRYWPLAQGVTRYVGEVVAIVVATDRYRAEDAAELVQVDYEPLDPVLELEAAPAVSARSFRYGDPERRMADAAHRVASTFRFPRYSSTPIECYAIVADWDPAEEEVTVWSNFHGPFVMQPLLARSLGLPGNRLRLICPPDIGGSFGIKSGVYAYIPLVALASRVAGVPVRWTADRWEDLVASQAGTDRLTRGELALDAEGRMTALRLEILDDVGAYLRPPEPATLYRCFGNMTGAYRIRDLAVEAKAVLTNRPPTGLNRGFGGQQLYFTLERLVDMAAHRLGVDPLELRRRNLIGPHDLPYRTPLGGVYDSGDLPRLLETARGAGGYERLVRERDRLRQEGRLAGIGAALIVDPSGTNLGYIEMARTKEERAEGQGKSGCTESATLTMGPGGEVRVRIATASEGQGHETVAAQIVADELGLPMELIRVDASVDTATQAWNVSSGSYSSRFAPITSSALLRACDELKRRLRAIAGDMLEVDPDDLELAQGVVRVRGTGRSVPVRRIAGLAHWDPGAIAPGVDPLLHVTASFSSDLARAPAPDETVDSSICYGGVLDLALVELDPDTFQVRVLDYVTVHDAGRILNPLLADGQIAGALAHGLGGAMYEELVYDEQGNPLAASFMDYLCPTLHEVPEPAIHHLEGTGTDFVPSSAKGIGEGNSMTAPAVVANAVSDALRPLGLEVTRLPVHGATIWRSLKEMRSER